MKLNERARLNFLHIYTRVKRSTRDLLKNGPATLCQIFRPARLHNLTRFYVLGHSPVGTRCRVIDHARQEKETIPFAHDSRTVPCEFFIARSLLLTNSGCASVCATISHFSALGVTRAVISAHGMRIERRTSLWSHVRYYYKLWYAVPRTKIIANCCKFGVLIRFNRI